MPRLNFGLTLQNFVAPGERIDIRDLIRTARRAEELGFSSIWAWDHILLGSKNVFPVYEALTVLASIATVTEKARLATGILALPLRNPVELAKRVATIDNLSGGRLTLGVAAGWYEREFQACGIPFKARGKILEENLEIMKRLWTRDQIAMTSGRYVMEHVTMEPKPVQKPHIPIWMGGYTEKAHDRLARLADGWICYLYTPASFKKAWHRLLEYTRTKGRDPSTLKNCNMIPVRIHEDKERATQTMISFVKKYCDLPPWSEATWDSGVVGGIGECVKSIEEQKAAGVQTLVMIPAISKLSEIDEQVERFGREIIPSFL